jgi:hypothetical protein
VCGKIPPSYCELVASIPFLDQVPVVDPLVIPLIGDPLVNLFSLVIPVAATATEADCRTHRAKMPFPLNCKRGETSLLEDRPKDLAIARELLHRDLISQELTKTEHYRHSFDKICDAKIEQDMTRHLF